MVRGAGGSMTLTGRLRGEVDDRFAEATAARTISAGDAFYSRTSPFILPPSASRRGIGVVQGQKIFVFGKHPSGNPTKVDSFGITDFEGYNVDHTSWTMRLVLTQDVIISANVMKGKRGVGEGEEGKIEPEELGTHIMMREREPHLNWFPPVPDWLGGSRQGGVDVPLRSRDCNGKEGFAASVCAKKPADSSTFVNGTTKETISEILNFFEEVLIINVLQHLRPNHFVAKNCSWEQIATRCSKAVDVEQQVANRAEEWVFMISPQLQIHRCCVCSLWLMYIYS
ncbi:hypothetical protein DFJ73DRAFT_757555 [Zopfochytrium polystomum]|nr:hypothetical protein DFJ73DRAFT_757555 [Zopfochytrium polystomum]